MRKYAPILWMMSYCCWAWAAEPAELRIQHWERCGDLFDARHVQICLTISGVAPEKATLRFNHKTVPPAQLQRDNQVWRVKFLRADMASGPLWLEQGEQKSNAVWISGGDSH